MTDITLPRAELQQVLEAMENFGTDWDGWHRTYMALRERLAQPEQALEPVAQRDELRDRLGSMTDREIMQQALDALEEMNKLSVGENAICLPAEIDGAMDALRERLAQPNEFNPDWDAMAAAELRRLNEVNAELLEALSDIAHGLESARIWGGIEWTYNTLHPVKYLPLRDKARTAIAKVRGEQT